MLNRIRKRTLFALVAKIIAIISVMLINLVVTLPLQATQIEDESSAILRKTIIGVENHLYEMDQNFPEKQLGGLGAWVDDSELKWSNSNINDFEAQKLSFEVKLKNREQINAEQQIINIGKSKAVLKLTGLLDKKLKATYFRLIDYIARKKRENLLQQQRLIANSELDSWKLKVNSNDFRADKLQQADLTLESIWAQELENSTGLSRFKSQRQDIEYNRNHNRNTAIDLNRQGLISIGQMIEISNEIIQSREYQQHNNVISKAEFDIDLANRQRQRRNAQEKISLNSFKLEYDNKDNDLGFSIGIKMPITRNSYDSLLQEQQRYYTMLDAQNVITEVSDQLSEAQYQLRSIQDQWLIKQRLLHKINIRINRLSRSNNLALLLDLKKERIHRRMQQQEIEIRALKKFIELLNISGMLSAKPYRNWLLSGTPRIL